MVDTPPECNGRTINVPLCLCCCRRCCRSRLTTASACTPACTTPQTAKLPPEAAARAQGLYDTWAKEVHDLLLKADPGGFFKECQAGATTVLKVGTYCTA